MSRLTALKQQIPKSQLVYMTPLVVFGLSLCCEQILAADTQKKAGESKPIAAISAGVSTSNSNVQPATSGVKLLEGIFLKLRNQPQLAFGNSRAQNMMQAANSVAAGKNSSATDQLLAIRPAERAGRGMRFDYAPNEFSLDAPAAQHSNAKSLVAAAPSKQVKPLAQSIQNFAGAAGALQEIAQTDTANIKSYGGYAGGSRNARQLQNAQVAAISDDRNYTNEKGRLVASAPMITEFKDTAVRSGLLKRVPAMSKSAAMVPPPPPAASPAAAAPQIAYAPNGPVLQSATNGTVGPQGADASYINSAPTLAPASPGLFKNIREFGTRDKAADSFSGAGSGVKELFDNGKYEHEALDKTKLAMLPPSIINGVPLVHLGASALQIKESLGTKVKIDKQTIEDWTVWSVSGNAAKGHNGDCALQLYFKHGVVEAIRIFDASYLGADLGVRLGNDLQTIKEKFGEPAFILPEPAGGRSIEAGKNYIYPISQVSFALARSHDKAKPAPQVVSMLIFNVK